MENAVLFAFKNRREKYDIFMGTPQIIGGQQIIFRRQGT